MKAATAQSRRVCGAALALLGLTGAAAALAGAPAALIQPGRPADSRRAAPAWLETLQQRLDRVAAADGSECEVSYAANKAQAWLNFARYAAAEQLPPRVQSSAAERAAALLQGLQQQAPAALETAELPGARHVRDDLWRAIESVKHDGRRCAAPKMTAFCEVQLAWVDYEAAAGGWQHVDPYVRIAEDYCGTAVRAAAAQPRPVPLPVAAEPQPLPPAATAPEAAPPRESALVVLFPHDRSQRSDIRRPGHAQLARLAQQVRALPAGSELVIVGNADLTGQDRYNLHLSTRRARSVARELRSLGVPAGQMRLSAVGSSEPVVQCSLRSQAGERRRYLRCLEPNRRVLIRVVTD